MANDYGPSIKLARLYEKTSKNGNTYMTGRLGGAKITLLKSRDVADDGSAIWDILLSQAPDKTRYTGGDVSYQVGGDGQDIGDKHFAGSDLNSRADRARDGDIEDIIPF